MKHRWRVLTPLILAACLTRPPARNTAPATPPPAAPAVSPWPGVLADARRAVESGRYTDADRTLTAFSDQHAESPEAAEADFFKALFRADPDNREATVRDQLAAFDSYLGRGRGAPRYTEALLLKRMVEAIDSSRTLIVAVRAASEARDRAKSDEVKRISDELEKAVAEMERIRRRLTPKPP